MIRSSSLSPLPPKQFSLCVVSLPPIVRIFAPLSHLPTTLPFCCSLFSHVTLKLMFPTCVCKYITRIPKKCSNIFMFSLPPSIKHQLSFIFCVKRNTQPSSKCFLCRAISGVWPHWSWRRRGNRHIQSFWLRRFHWSGTTSIVGAY